MNWQEAFSWTAALRQEILGPLGMARTMPLPKAPHARGFAVHPWADVLLPEPAHDAVAMAPAGQLWSTVTDLCRWAAFWCGDTGQVLHADTIGEIAAPARPPW
jgi:CubicO group peptidase (beta-lactamase class C family)